MDKHYVFCPICHVELAARKDGRFPRHSPKRAAVAFITGELPKVCIGSGLLVMTPDSAGTGNVES